MTRGLKLKETSSWALHRKYRSENEEDTFVIKYFQEKMNGFLLDISAADGVTGSNSFQLIDEYHWSGLLVEPCPTHKHNLETLYNNVDDVDVFFGAIDKNHDEITFHELGGNCIGMSYTAPRSHGAPENCPFPIQKSYLVKAKDINSLLREYNTPTHIDFFSLDVEGAEREIIEDIDMSKYSIDLWCIECDTSSKILYGDHMFDEFFLDHGYEKLYPKNISKDNEFWGKT